MRWDPNKRPPGTILFLLMGGWTHCFTILFSYWFSITTIGNPIVTNPKKNGSAKPILFLFGGVLAIGSRDYILLCYVIFCFLLFPCFGVLTWGISTMAIGEYPQIIHFRLGCSIINHPFWRSSIYGNPHIYMHNNIYISPCSKGESSALWRSPFLVCCFKSECFLPSKVNICFSWFKNTSKSHPLNIEQPPNGSKYL